MTNKTKKLTRMAGFLLILSSHSGAAIIEYTLQGQFEAKSYHDPTLTSAYQQYGVEVGKMMSFVISIDTANPGFIVDNEGNTSYLDRHIETFERLSDGRAWYSIDENTGQAQLLYSAGINFSASTNQENKRLNYYTNSIYNNYFESAWEAGGFINLGSSIQFARQTTGSLNYKVQDWEPGDLIYTSLRFDNGLGELRLVDYFSITEKRIDGVANVPLPSTGIFFLCATSIFGVISKIRKVAMRQPA